MSDSSSTSEAHWKWMRRAVDLGNRSTAEDGLVKPKVGVVITRDGQLIGESFRGETGEGRHAEFGLIDKLAGQSLEGATAYSTLEPCSRRNHPKIPCAVHLANAGVKEVFIGIYDPNPKIYREGWRLLRDSGVTLRDFPAELRAEIASANSDFLDTFRTAASERGTVTFDYHLNGGRFTVTVGGLEVCTRWTQRGADSIYAIDSSGHVALARHAREFSEIDDPGALDWANYTVQVAMGEIVAFRRDWTYVLARVVRVHAGSEWGADRTELTFDYEGRLPRS